ncbi:BTAD domain-containing putative transcriptional regulator [Streptomyces polygonati]|uniref:BTAD domain-containing putative transcriptional regulator n=1 Tax=Streptomyces polygonati TaxID=1617087 RepID=A0ABV8HI59_9ACTN
MNLRLLGPLEVDADGAPVRVGGPRQQIVLSVLALAANHVIPWDRLIGAVWDDTPPSTARSQIHICISALRRTLTPGQATIATRSPGYMLTVPDEALDAHTFHHLVADARTAVGRDEPRLAADQLRQALALWRGPALAGIPSRVVQAGAAELEEARLSATEERIRLDLHLGRHHELTGELTALAVEEPFRERIQEHLMLALYRSGRQVDALDSYRRVRTRFIDELGIEPSEELQRLHHDILTRDSRLDPPAPLPQDRSARPERVALVMVPRQLPADLPDFTGRRPELSQIRDFLLAGHDGADGSQGPDDRSGPRTVAISGQGGVGKTSLAVRAAHEASAAYPDGQLFADLGDFPDLAESAHEVRARFLRALGMSGAGIPDDLEERAELYRSRLARARALIVLDNAASEKQVAALSPGCGGCAVITTSRSRATGLPGACQLDLDVFDLARSTELLTMIIGADRTTAEPESVEALARRCGGLPLALRIAGARLAARRHWPVGRLVERLDDERHTLGELVHGNLEVRGCLRESYVALDPAARQLFRRLALLRAPDFPAWVASTLCPRGMLDAEDLLEELVDARLLEASDGAPSRAARYRFHQLVRVFARERLDAEEPAEEQRPALARTLGAWLSLAGEAHRREYGGDYLTLHGPAVRAVLPDPVRDRLLVQPMVWLEGERQSLTTGVRQAAEYDLPELCWDLALAATTLFKARGYTADWRETARTAATAARRADLRRGAAASHYSLGCLDLTQERRDSAKRHLDAALELFTALGDEHGAGLVQRSLGQFDRLTGQTETAYRRWSTALGSLRRVGDPIGEAYVLRDIAEARTAAGQYQPARKALVRALSLCRRAGSYRAEAQVRCQFGDLHLRTGRIDAAERGFHWALRIARDDRDSVGEARALHGLGLVRRRQHRYVQASTALEQALRVTRMAGDRHLESQVLLALGAGPAPENPRAGDPRSGTGEPPAAPRAPRSPAVASSSLGERLCVQPALYA